MAMYLSQIKNSIFIQHTELEELTGSSHGRMMRLVRFKIALDINSDKEITHWDIRDYKYLYEGYKLPEITAWSLISCMWLCITGILARSSAPCGI